MPERIVVLVASAVYVVFAARHVVGIGDSAEMAALSAHGGVAHPSGYPLFVLAMRLLAWLPTSAAHAAALTDALLGGISIAALQWASRSWGASRSASAVASGLYALSPIALEQATLPEVFVLNVAIAMTIVAVAGPLSLPWIRDETRLALLGLLAGLGLSNQLTVVLIAPVGLVAAVQAIRLSARPVRALAGGVAGLALGLLPYAYLPFAARTAPSECVWTRFDDVRTIVRHFLRSDYGTASLAAYKGASDRAGQEWLFATSFAASLLWAPLLAGLPFGGWRPRRSTLLLVATACVAGPLFVLLFNVGTQGNSVSIVRRFHLLGLALAAVLGARALTHLHARAPRHAQVTLAFLFLVSVVRIAWSGMSPRPDTPTLEQYTANVLRMLPPSSILVVEADASVGAFMYAQCAEGQRPDVTTLVPRRLFAESYRARTRQLTGIDLVPVDGHLKASDILGSALATGRPVYLAEWFSPGLDQEFASYPLGPLIRVVTKPEEMLDPSRLLRANDELFARFTLESPRPIAGTPPASYYRDYARSWSLLATAFAQRGRRDLADACAARAADLAPSPEDSFFGGVTE